MLMTGREHSEKNGVRIDSYGPSAAEENHSGDGNAIIGYIEPAGDNAQWIMWFTAKGDAVIYTQRSYANGDTGAVQDEEPIRLRGHEANPQFVSATKP